MNGERRHSFTGRSLPDYRVRCDRKRLRSFNSILKRCLYSIVCLLMILHSTSATAGEQTLDKVVLQLKFKHQFQFAGYYAAKQQGYYRDAGLEVEIRDAAITDHSIDPVLNGSANFGVGTSSLLLKRYQGSPLVVLAVIFQHSPYVLITPQLKDTQGLHDLINQKVMISHQAEELLAMLKRSGVPLESLDNIEHSFHFDDLIDGKIKAMSGYLSNQAQTLRKTGHQFNLYTPRSVGIDFYGDNLFTTEQEIRKHPGRVSKFIQASLKGWEYALAHQQEIIQLIKQEYKSDKSVADLQFEAHQIIDLIQPQLLKIGHMDLRRWQHIANTYTELDMLPADFDITDFIYDPEAKKELQIFLLHSAAITLVVLLLAYHIRKLILSKQKAHKEMRFMNTILKTQQQSSIDGIIIFDSRGRLISYNHKMKELWQLSDKTLANKSPAQITRAILKKLKDPKQFLAIARHLSKHPYEQHFAEITLADGHIFERFSAPIIDERKQLHGRFWSFRDITERKQAEEKIWVQANFDSLTELPNRFMLIDRLNYEIKKSHRTKKLVAVLFLDLDRFKEINDTMGHGMGDQLLIETARRLKHCIRDVDMVARLGGDEFTVILTDLDKAADIERVANSILSALSAPFKLGDKQAYISTSIGIALAPLNGDSSEQLLKHADQAMYSAKAQGRARFQYFTPSMHKHAIARVELINDLRQAISQQQLYLVYQPIVCLKKRRITKAEALIRWQHPVKGLIAPDDFIFLAEETGLIREIGEWVFKQAVKQAARWQEIDPDFQITVNTSPGQFHDNGIEVDRWIERLKTNKLNGDSVVIEITENLLLGTDEKILDKLASFRKHGIQVSLDDFATGYSSLSYLKEFDIDYLKIDRSFVKHLAPGTKEFVLCQAIISIANQFGIQVIAEGIETPEQYQLLQDFNCDYGQGYYFSKPVKADEFEELLIADKT